MEDQRHSFYPTAFATWFTIVSKTGISISLVEQFVIAQSESQQLAKVNVYLYTLLGKFKEEVNSEEISICTFEQIYFNRYT